MREARAELLQAMQLLDFLHEINENANEIISYEEFHNEEARSCLSSLVPPSVSPPAPTRCLLPHEGSGRSSSGRPAGREGSGEERRQGQDSAFSVRC